MFACSESNFADEMRQSLGQHVYETIDVNNMNVGVVTVQATAFTVETYASHIMSV